jgi:DMSO/TMAO reductase YedYZ heme-binding membrane subunit
MSGARASVKTIAAAVCYGGALAVCGALALVGWGRPWAFERALFFTRASGWCATALLLLALCASPIGRIARRAGRPADRGVAASRRALGIAAAAVATVHGALALSTYLAGALGHVLDFVWVRAGMIAWSVLAALWLTSYPRVVRALRVKLWKPLHRLAYVAALFALQHAILAPLAPRSWVLGAFGIAAVVGLLRFVPARSSPRTERAAPAAAHRDDAA